jgi:hypothetical protein
VKALIVANEFLEAQLAELQAAVSNGYTRGSLPRARIGMIEWSQSHGRNHLLRRVAVRR